MLSPKLLIKKAIRRVLTGLYGDHPLDRVWWELRRMERARRQFAPRSELTAQVAALSKRMRDSARATEQAVSQILAEAATGFRQRDQSLASLKQLADAQDQTLTQLAAYLGISFDDLQEDGQVKGQRLPDRFESIDVEIDGVWATFESALGQQATAQDQAIERLAAYLGISYKDLQEDGEVKGRRLLDRLESIDVEINALLSKQRNQANLVSALQELLEDTSQETLSRLGELDQATSLSKEEIERLGSLVASLENAELPRHIDRLSSSDSDLRERVAALALQLQELRETSKAQALPELEKYLAEVSGLKDSIEESGIAAGRDRRLLHELRSWSDSVVSLDLEVRLGQWERAAATLEKLEAKLEDLAEGVEGTQDAGRKIADQVRRTRSRLDAIESSVELEQSQSFVAREYQDAMSGIDVLREQSETKFRDSNDRLRKIENLNRRTRDLVRRHLENHHIAGFQPDPWLQSSHNRHKGERCFLIGSGPSLAQLDTSQLKGAGSIMTVNGAAQLEGMVSDYFMTVAHVWWTQHVDWLNKQDVRIRRFLPAYVECDDACTPTSRVCVSSADEAQIRAMSAPLGFGRDPASQIFLGGTVIFPALQVLHYLGFSEVVLLGIDHCYDLESGSTRENVVSSNSIRHYKANYYPNQADISCDIAAMERSYEVALQAWQSSGRRLVNATLGTRLDIVPCVPLDDVLGKVSSESPGSASVGARRKSRTAPRKKAANVVAKKTTQQRRRAK